MVNRSSYQFWFDSISFDLFEVYVVFGFVHFDLDVFDSILIQGLRLFYFDYKHRFYQIIIKLGQTKTNRSKPNRKNRNITKT